MGGICKKCGKEYLTKECIKCRDGAEVKITSKHFIVILLIIITSLMLYREYKEYKQEKQAVQFLNNAGIKGKNMNETMKNYQKQINKYNNDINKILGAK